MPRIAISDPIIPSRILRQIKGLRMNFLVAPTICIVLIVKRFEWTANLMELFIKRTAMAVKIPLIIKTHKLSRFTLLFISETKSLSYLMSSTKFFFKVLSEILSRRRAVTYSALRFTSIEFF